MLLPELGSLHLPRRLLAADGPSRCWEQPLFACASRDWDLWEGTGQGERRGGWFCLPRGNVVGPRAGFCAGGLCSGGECTVRGLLGWMGVEAASQRGTGCAASPSPPCAGLWGLTGTRYLWGPAGVSKSCSGSQ